MTTRDLFCGCNYWRPCLWHRCVSRSSFRAGPNGRWIKADLQQEYADRCRAVAIMEQFRKVLAVIAWSAAHCPQCGAYDRGRGCARQNPWAYHIGNPFGQDAPWAPERWA